MKLTTMLILVLLASCAQRIKVPINRMMTSETIGGGVGIEYQQMGFSSGKLDFEDNETDNALVMGQVVENNFHLDVSPADRLDIFVDVPKESSSRVGVKIQVLGEPEKKKAEGNQIAFSLATGSAQDTFDDDDDFKIKLKSSLEDYSIIHGYRFNPNIMIYEGISLTSFKFTGDIEDAGDLESDTFSYKADNILGVFAGAAFGGTGFKAKAEVAAQQIQWSNTGSKIFYSFGYSLMAYW